MKKYKKERKEKEPADEPQEQPEQSTETAPAEEHSQRHQKNARFICFVGNLPYSATADSLRKHFEKNPPASVRVATEKDKPTKCRGFGFIEFDNYDRMKTCLKLYHHSMFDDGKYPPRRINVELTAGGGGKSEHRRAKIEAKNKKLNEERQRQAKNIQKEKTKSKNTHSKENEEQGADQWAGIHPSRRARMA